MFNFANSIAAVIAAALAASVAVVLTSGVPEAGAETLQAPLLQPDTMAKAPACALQGWPHYERNCHFDLRTGNTEPRIVRVVALRLRPRQAAKRDADEFTLARLALFRWGFLPPRAVCA